MREKEREKKHINTEFFFLLFQKYVRDIQEKLLNK